MVRLLCSLIKESRGGAAVRMWPGFDSRTQRRMWVEFFVGSLLALRGFSPVFPSPQKPTFPNSNSICNAHTRINEFLRAFRCYVGKYITVYHFSLSFGQTVIQVIQSLDVPICAQRLAMVRQTDLCANLS